MRTQKITLSGGFHNASDINLRLKNDELSEGQYKRLRNHMCGIKECVCGWRGYELDGIDPSVFLQILLDVEYRLSCK